MRFSHELFSNFNGSILNKQLKLLFTQTKSLECVRCIINCRKDACYNELNGILWICRWLSFSNKKNEGKEEIKLKKFLLGKAQAKRLIRDHRNYVLWWDKIRWLINLLLEGFLLTKDGSRLRGYVISRRSIKLWKRLKNVWRLRSYKKWFWWNWEIVIFKIMTLKLRFKSWVILV